MTRNRFVDSITSDTSDTTAALVAFGLVLCDPEIMGMFSERPRFQAGSPVYAPHLHALAFQKSWADAMRGSSPGRSVRGDEAHRAHGVQEHPEALYRATLYLSVPAIRRAANRGIVTRSGMDHFEDAYASAAQAYGVPAKYVEDVAWPRHERNFDDTVATLVAPNKVADMLWRDVVSTIGLEVQQRKELAWAFAKLTPWSIAESFQAGRARCFPEDPEGW